MKYIRTKNKIYEVIEETENSFELCGPFEKKMGCNCIMLKRMLGSKEKPTYKLANTIEKLCDVFVCEDSLGNHSAHTDLLFLKIAVKMTINMMKPRKLRVVIFGAIWTHKGLIYVARMNSKGELELL